MIDDLSQRRASWEGENPPLRFSEVQLSVIVQWKRFTQVVLSLAVSVNLLAHLLLQSLIILKQPMFQPRQMPLSRALKSRSPGTTMPDFES